MLRDAPGQEPLHDGHAATESAWRAPEVALARYLEGRIQLAPPRIVSLAGLAGSCSVERRS